MERSHQRAGQRRFPGTDRPAQRDDIAGTQRRGEAARERVERGEPVEDVLSISQNSDRCCCA